RVGEGHPAQRLQQKLPTPDANRQIHKHGRQQQHQPSKPHANDRSRDAPQIDLVQKQGQQGGQQRHDENGTEMGSHQRGPPSTIPPYGVSAATTLHVVVVNKSSALVRCVSFSPRGNLLP